MENTNQKRAKIEQLLLEKAVKDDQFRKNLLSDPRKTISAELGFDIPEDLQVRILEETPMHFYLVLPALNTLDTDFELSEQDLKNVSGGAGENPNYTEDNSTCDV